MGKKKRKSTVRSAGFDLTDFGTPQKFREVLKANKMRYLGKYSRKLSGKHAYYIHQWGNKDILMGTLNNPITGQYGEIGRRPNEKGYASYMGIKGKRAQVAKLVASIKKKAKYIKAYDARQAGFVGTGTRPRKKRKTTKRKR